MGVGRASAVIVKGVLQAIIGNVGLELVLVGDEARIRREPDLEGMHGKGARFQIIHASREVRMDDPQVQAIET